MDFLAWVASLQKPLLWVAISLSVPSMVLYVLEVVVILRRKQFRASAFYALFAARGVPDVLSVLNSYYCYRLPTLFGRFLFPLYSRLPNACLAAFEFLVDYTFQANNMATAFMLINRLTAIALPWKQEKLWRGFLPYVLALIFGLPLLNYEYWSKEFVILPKRDENNETVSFFIMFKDMSELYWGTLRPALVSVVFLVACTLLNVGTLVVYSRTKARLKVEKSPAEKRTDRKLLVYALATFAGHALIALFMIAQCFLSSMTNMALVMAIEVQYPWLMDSGTVVLSSWLLLWGSDSFREQFLADTLPAWALRRLDPGNSSSQNCVRVSSTALQVRPAPNNRVTQQHHNRM